jgi:hypothetical protein
LLPVVSSGQTSDYLDDSNNYQGAFANYRIDARALALGGAYTALSDGATAFHWNPGGLGYSKGKEVTGMYERLYGLINSGYAAYAQGNPKKGEGYSTAWINTSASIEDTLGYSENTILASYGKRVSPTVSFGGTVKLLLVSSDFQDGNASGFGLNLGASIRPVPQAKFGVAIRDLITRVSWDTDRSDRLPGDVGVGFAYAPILPKPKAPYPKVTIAGELSGGEEEALKRISLGVEGWAVERILSLRGGFSRNFDALARNVFSLGTGIEFDAGTAHYFIDFAFVLDSSKDNLGSSPIFSAGGRF